MPFDTFFGFDSGDGDDNRWILRILAYRQGKATGVPAGLIARVKGTKVGQTFVIPLARTMTPGQAYDAGHLATFLGQGWTKRKVAAKLNVLGRPEKKFAARIFQRPSPGQYAMSQAMKDALLAP